MDGLQDRGVLTPGLYLGLSDYPVRISPLTEALTMPLRSHQRADYDACGEILADAVRNSSPIFAKMESSLAMVLDG